MQKLLIEEFSKKYKEENKYTRLSKYEYSIGDEKIGVELGENDVILKLDEFIDIINERKEEQYEEEYKENESIEEVNEENDEETIEVNM